MRLKQEHYEKSTLDRKLKRLKNVDSIKGVFIFVLRSQKSIFPDCPFLFVSSQSYITISTPFGAFTSVCTEPSACFTWLMLTVPKGVG